MFFLQNEKVANFISGIFLPSIGGQLPSIQIGYLWNYDKLKHLVSETYRAYRYIFLVFAVFANLYYQPLLPQLYNL
jgi:hypothetical protein